MTLRLSNSRGMSYTFPLDPQHYTADIKPRFADEKTLGGSVIQLLGFAMDVRVSGLLNNHMADQQQYWREEEVLANFLSRLMLAQRDGIASHMYYDVHEIDYDVAIGDYSISETYDQKGFQYSLQAYMVSNGKIKDANIRRSIFDKITSYVGFRPGVSGFHGGDNDIGFIKTITGFSDTGPTASTAGDAKLSSDSSKREIQDYAKSQVLGRYGWTQNDFEALVQIWNRESGWNFKAENPTSHAYGIPQALPADKMASIAPDWKTNPKTQVDWGLQYIKNRYGSPSNAWRIWQSQHWY